MSVRSSRTERLQHIREKGGTADDDVDSDDDALHSRATVLPFPQAQLASRFAGDTESTPTIDPYVGKLERYELFCTNQSYYLVGCNKRNTAYRVLKMDRTLIELPRENTDPPTTETEQLDQTNPASSNASTNFEHQAVADAAHKSKPTLRPLSDFLTEDPNVYTQEEIHDMLDMIHDGNRLRREGSGGDGTGQDGGLKPIAKAYGIVGFIRFLDCYYLTLITRRSKVGSIGGNGVYSIRNTETFPIKSAERVPGSSNAEMDIHADPSSVLLNMWNRGKRSVGLGLTNREIAELRYQGLYQVVDLTKNFFFSYTYDLTRSLQENFLSNTSKPFPPPPFKDMFAWNHFLTRELEACCSSLSSFNWVMPIIHGAFVQRKLNDYGRSLNVTLLARRSRHFAGTRYLKRGVSEQGKVANDVEHEQIIHDESRSASDGIFSSFLQIRGSIPTFWTQESSVTMPKPPIELNRVDPTYTATQLHFEDLMKRYGSPIVVLDLVKQSEKREREVRVGNEYRHAIDYINTSIDDDHKVRYCALDYSHISKHRNLDVSKSLNEVSTWAVNQTGFFCSSPQWKITDTGTIEPFGEKDRQAASVVPSQLGVPVFPMEQTGILRTNCIDCLDRTNVAQFSAGVEAMEQQLVVMGIRSSPKLDPSSNIVRVLIDMYVDIGDHIALQYGGSEAHKKVNTERSESIVGPIGKHKELLTSIRRYYSNAFTDRLKQDAMNLFLGYYVPYRHNIPLWELETDYYLHNFHVRMGRGTSQSMKGFQMAFGVLDWNEEEIDRDADNGLDNSIMSGGSGRRPNMQRSSSRTSTTGSIENASARQENHTRRILNVRNRCTSQEKALSIWWKIALQANVQQRMWMQLGSSTTESVVLPRFDRLYQPEKMAQFDRFFARPWATPVRRAHSSPRGSKANGDEQYATFRRQITSQRSIESVPSPRSKPHEKSNSEGDSTSISTSLDRLVEENGFHPYRETPMQQFIEYHEKERESNSTDVDFHSYIGDSVETNKSVPEEYLEYVRPQDDNSSPFRPDAFQEYCAALYPQSLSANDVRGIHELAMSAHIGRTLYSGQYSGLSHDTSAIAVETVAQEQINAYEKMRIRGELRDGIPLMDAELKRRGFYSDSTREAVNEGCNRMGDAESHYSMAFLEPSRSSTRSGFSTAKSLQLYSSFFPPDEEMTTTDLKFILGDQADVKRTRNLVGTGDSKKKTSGFESRSKRFGITVTSHSDLLTSKSQPLFHFERRQEVPVGFEMINEDYFARKDNKFMVFNGAGVDSWKRTEPVTKISGIEKMLLGTLN